MVHRFVGLLQQIERLGTVARINGNAAGARYFATTAAEFSQGMTMNLATSTFPTPNMIGHELFNRHGA